MSQKWIREKPWKMEEIRNARIVKESGVNKELQQIVFCEGRAFRRFVIRQRIESRYDQNDSRMTDFRGSIWHLKRMHPHQANLEGICVSAG
jgi:hypothetical protein